MEALRLIYILVSFNQMHRLILDYDEVQRYQTCLSKIQSGVCVFAFLFELIKSSLITTLMVFCPFRMNNVCTYVVALISSIANLLVAMKISVLIKGQQKNIVKMKECDWTKER